MQAKLLLIEDTASLAETLARGFAEAGFETRIAHTAAAASLALESDLPDALILDQLSSAMAAAYWWKAAEGGGARFLIQVPIATARREPALPAQP
jgi:DNA-binding response OmpR family regulator